ncbi:Integrin alpha-PS2 [Eumeta japonica]|uniref:Integrin alpha-PS2 n=1 Tax=Eumeta variegata TaxID=151549 RepID=A0A4C1TT45_EUMVA|nr:Integrin alpha-PS2 [Eumeta japonica]
MAGSYISGLPDECKDSMVKYFDRFRSVGQLYSLNPDKPTVLATSQDSAVYDDSYMGYSMAAGGFGEEGTQAIAVGVPRGSKLRGLVVLYTMDLQVIRNISGSQIGAYFGYCLASGDIDGDGLDDVIIGAPMYTKARSEGYEHGRVYVVYQGRDQSFQRNHYRTGEVSKGRFGLAVTSLGDINLDGFGDLAVGAPYSGKNGRGMVFIYYGSAQGLRETYSQAIAAEEVDPYLTTFGFSLSGGLDLDMNNFTDLAVGAYKSDSVVFFSIYGFVRYTLASHAVCYPYVSLSSRSTCRSRPVIKVTAMLELRSYNNELKEISLDDTSCVLSNGTRVGCATLKYCLTYDAQDVYTRLEFKVIFNLDSAKTSSKRLYIMYSEGRRTQFVRNMVLTKGHKQCGNTTVYLIEKIRDKLTPLEIAMSYDVITQKTPNVIPPILDQTMENIHTDSLSITKNCGSDNICIPDLQMAVTTSTANYILGSDQKVDIDVEVANTKEDAFEAAYYLHIPRGVSYNRMQMQTPDGQEQLPVYCSVSARHANGSSTLRCDVGNPLPSGRKVNFRVTLEVDVSVTSLEFDMETNSTNPEEGTYEDNRRHMAISVVIESKLLAIGTSDPPELYYNASLYQYDAVADDRQLGPTVIHKYNIKNDSPFAIKQAQIVILWPYQTLYDENLMYMLMQPETVGPVQCYAEEHIDPLKLFVRTSSKSYLESERAEYARSKFAASTWTSRNRNESRTTVFVSSQSGGSSSNDHDSRTTWESSGSTMNGYRQREQEAGYNANGGYVNTGATRTSETGGSFSSTYGAVNANSQDQSYRNQQYGGNQNNQGQWTHGFDSSASNDQRHSWSTEETVNRDIMNAGSRTYHNVGSNTANAGLTVVGGSEDDEINNSFGANAALNPSNNFRTSISEVSVGGSSQGNQGGSLNVETQGGSLASGSSQGQVMHGGNYAGSGSSSRSYSYSSSSGSRSGGAQYSYGSQSGGSSSSQMGGSSSASWSSNRENTRRKRQAEMSNEIKEGIEKCQDKFKCGQIVCHTDYLEKGQDVWIALVARLNASVLNEMTKERAVTLSTMALAQVFELETVGKPTQMSVQKQEVKTLITQQLEARSSGTIPLWVVILAAVVGALLLLLLIFALYKNKAGLTFLKQTSTGSRQ